MLTDSHGWDWVLQSLSQLIAEQRGPQGFSAGLDAAQHVVLR
jgi:hypothetical protein